LALKVGTDAFSGIQTDPQLANRFEPAVLRRRTMGGDYLRLLASFRRSRSNSSTAPGSSSLP
jgi:hypothetical protein